MAKYAISQEGLDSLDKLSAGLMQVVTGIDDACKTLYTKIERLESGLGVYEKDILLCLREVIAANKQGKDGVAHLVTTAIPRQKAIIEEIMAMVDGTSGEEDVYPPQKAPAAPAVSSRSLFACTWRRLSPEVSPIKR